MKSYTLAIVKPDITQWHERCDILSFMGERFTVEEVMHRSIIEPLWETFYKEHRGAPFFWDLVRFMASGPVTLVILSGDVDKPDWAALRWRELIGATDPRKAEEGTIRWRYGDKNGPIMRNAVHGSDPPNVMREIEFFSRSTSRFGTQILWEKGR